MALLASCWLITESFVIPYGFLKWFYLSFYIHPFFLVFCQIFLWLKVLLKKWVMLLCFPLVNVALSLSLLVFEFINRPVDDQVYYYEVLDLLQDWEIVVTCNKARVQSVKTGIACKVASNVDSSCYPIQEIIDHKKYSLQDSWLNQYLYSDHCSSDICGNSSFRFSSFLDFESNEISSSIINQGDSSSDMLSISQEHNIFSPVSSFNLNEEFLSTAFDDHLKPLEDDDNNIDQFHEKYNSRMRFFNLLYQERLHGMEMLSNPHSMEWDRKRILKSLEYDVEMIYVAQCCLLWEALHHQYQKVHEDIKFSSGNDTTLLYEHSVAAKFQELQILLERFVEDQSSCSDMHKRLCFQSLLQVPDAATGLMFIEEENKRMMGGGEGMRGSQVLEGINKCIEALWLYIQRDDKKSSSSSISCSRVYKLVIWSNSPPPPPVEDPQDLELLYLVTKTLHKKRVMLKDVQGKAKCWLRKKVKALQTEDDKRDVVFATIDIKLVQRLLKMPLVSTSHLNWCKEKLNNLDFKQGKVFRGCTTLLFPSS